MPKPCAGCGWRCLGENGGRGRAGDARQQCPVLPAQLCEHGAGLGLPVPGLCWSVWGPHPVPPTGRSTTTCGASCARSTRTTASLTSLSVSGTALTGECVVLGLLSAQGCWLWFGGPLGSPLSGLWLGVGSGEGEQGPPTPAACPQVGLSEGPALSWTESVLPLCHPQLEENGDGFSSRLPESGNNDYPGVTYTDLGGRKCVSPWQGSHGFRLSQSELARHNWARDKFQCSPKAHHASECSVCL